MSLKLLCFSIEMSFLFTVLAPNLVFFFPLETLQARLQVAVATTPDRDDN